MDVEGADLADLSSARPHRDEPDDLLRLRGHVDDGTGIRARAQYRLVAADRWLERGQPLGREEASPTGPTGGGVDRGDRRRVREDRRPKRKSSSIGHPQPVKRSDPSRMAGHTTPVAKRRP